MLPENEYSEIESRYYLNPQVGLDESNKFIENLRSIQQQNNSQIAKDTAALGTEVSSNLGGLTGANSYFASRYQTPQTNATVANLRAAAQAKALNDVLANEQAIWKNRYQDAYRAYQKRAYNKANSGSGSNGGNTSSWDGESELIPTDTTSTSSTSDTTTPPREEDYYITGEEQNKKIEEQTGLPEWLVNVLKIFG